MKSSCRGLYVDLYNIALYMAALQLRVHGWGLSEWGLWDLAVRDLLLRLRNHSTCAILVLPINFLCSAIKVVNFYSATS